MATTSPLVPAGLRPHDLTAADLTIVPANEASWEDIQTVFGDRTIGTHALGVRTRRVIGVSLSPIISARSTHGALAAAGTACREELRP